MTNPFTRFDRDPDALAWARSKVQAEVDRARMLGEEAAAARDPEQSEVWRRLAHRMQRVLVGGKGCVHGAFDERLPELVAEIDTLRAAEPAAPAAGELAPPAPQEPTVRIQPGQVYIACHPLDEGRRIRVATYIPGHAQAHVVDAVTGKRPRWIQVAALHPTATTRAGEPRRTGYALEGEAS